MSTLVGSPLEPLVQYLTLLHGDLRMSFLCLEYPPCLQLSPLSCGNLMALTRSDFCSELRCTLPMPPCLAVWSRTPPLRPSQEPGVLEQLIQMATPCAWGMAGQGVTFQKMTSAVSCVRLSLHYFISVSDTPGELQCFHCSNETVDRVT